MNKKIRKRYSGEWQMTIDRYMSGSFWPLFGWALFFSTIAFLGIWCFLSWIGVDWSLGDAFIQMTNPSSSSLGVFDVNYSEWFAIVVTNLFGLFVINGIILTLLVNWVSNRKDRHEKGEARYNHIFDKQFCVIIGGHKIVASLTRDLLKNYDKDFILIQTQRDPIEVRREIAAEVKDSKAIRKVVIYSGDRTSRHELQELHLQKAREIYIIGEPFSIDKTSHDSISLQTWDIITDSRNDNLEAEKKSENKGEDFHGKKIPCHIMFEYQSTFSAFQFTDVKENDTYRFIPFSLYENWAQQLLIKKSYKDTHYIYTPLDGKEGISYESDQRVHLIVVGMSKMGLAVALEAAHIAHFPNFENPKVGNPRTLITFIDRDAKREMLYLMGRFKELFKMARWRLVEAPQEIIPPNENGWNIYDSISEIPGSSKREFPWNDPLKDEKLKSPYYGGYLGDNLIDIDFEFMQGDVALPSIQDYIKNACADKRSKTTIAVCFPVAVESMSTALYFDSSVYGDVQQIWVYQSESGALADTISEGETGKNKSKYHSIRPFGMIEKCDYMERIHSVLPKLVAYVYDNIGKSTPSDYVPPIAENFMNKVEDNWLAISSRKGGKSAIAQRWSNIYCANTFGTKLRPLRLKYGIDNLLTEPETIDMMAKVEHNRWVIEQLLLGLRPVDRFYKGPFPNVSKEEKANLKSLNIHTNIVSNELLNDSEREYDKEIAKIIPLACYLSTLKTE